MQPNGLRPPQDGAKFGSASAGSAPAGVSVAPWPSCWSSRTTSASATALIRALRERGHAVNSAGTALAGLRQAVEDRPDLVVLDLGLPDLDGRELLRMLRAVSAVPVIVATARDDDDSVVQALDAGADDYVVKPFQAGQLEARIRAVLRRAAGAGRRPQPPITVGDLTVDPRSRRVTLDGRRSSWRPRSSTCCAYLAAPPGHVVTKRELLTEVWQLPYGGADKTVDVHLSWLRRKLGESAADAALLHTVRGVGVRLAEPEP